MLSLSWLVPAAAGTASAQHEPRHALTEPSNLASDANGTGQLEFIHIPKAAGTTIEDAGTGHGYKWGRNKLDTFWSEDAALMSNTTFHRCSWWHIPPASFMQALGSSPYDNSETFCVVRHPFTRALSQVLYHAYSEHLEHNDIQLACTAEALSAKLSEALDKVESFLTSFEAWDGSLNDNATCQDCHWLPQVAYTHGPHVAPCQHVLRFETLSVDWDALMRGRSPAIPSSELQTKAANQAPRHTPCSPTVGNLSSQVRARLASLYEADFAAYNYSIEFADEPADTPATKQVETSHHVSTAHGMTEGWKLIASLIKLRSTDVIDSILD